MTEEIKVKGNKLQFPNIFYTGYRLISDRPAKIVPLANFVRDSLARAHMRISHIVYMGSMFFWSIVASIIVLGVSGPILYFARGILGLDLSLIQLAVYAVGAAIGAFGLIMGIFLYYPLYKSDRLKSGIDKNLVYVINYMGILSGAGIVTEDIFSSLVETGDTYMISDSAASIVRDIGLLGKDIITAMEDESTITPSKKYSKLLVGILGINKTGGDLKDYLLESAEHEMEVRKRELNDVVNKLNLAAEIYTTIGVAFPIILIVLLSLMGIFGGTVAAGLGPVAIMRLMTYILFPLMSVGVILLIDGMCQNW